MRHSRVALLAGMIVALLAVTACNGTAPAATTPTGTTTSPSSGTATASARTTVCNGLATINQTLSSLANLNANTTVGEVKAVQAKVTNVLNAIDRLVPSASGDLLNQIRAANEQLTAAIQDYPDSTPIGQTSARVQDLKATVANAQSRTTQLATRLKCPS